MAAVASIKTITAKVLWKLGLYDSARRLLEYSRKSAARLRSEWLLAKGIDSYLEVARSQALLGQVPEGLPDARWRSAWWRFKGAPDRLQIPSGELLYTIAGTPNVKWFLHGGRLGGKSIHEVMLKNGVDLASIKRVLDLGCGCGRVIRHLGFFEGAELVGTDYNPKLIEWCQANLAFGHFDINELDPPLKYADGSFDFIYALSVFTHLTERLQLLWMKELKRVIRPGGYLLVTLHGTFYFNRLTPFEQEQFQKGELVVKDAGSAGSNYCAAFHPESYVREKMTDGFEVLDHIPEGARGNPWQDLYLLRKKS